MCSSRPLVRHGRFTQRASLPGLVTRSGHFETPSDIASLIYNTSYCMYLMKLIQVSSKRADLIDFLDSTSRVRCFVSPPSFDVTVEENHEIRCYQHLALQQIKLYERCCQQRNMSPVSGKRSLFRTMEHNLFIRLYIHNTPATMYIHHDTQICNKIEQTCPPCLVHHLKNSLAHLPSSTPQRPKCPEQLPVPVSPQQQRLMTRGSSKPILLLLAPTRSPSTAKVSRKVALSTRKKEKRKLTRKNHHRTARDAISRSQDRF